MKKYCSVIIAFLCLALAGCEPEGEKITVKGFNCNIQYWGKIITGPVETQGSLTVFYQADDNTINRYNLFLCSQRYLNLITLVPGEAFYSVYCQENPRTNSAFDYTIFFNYRPTLEDIMPFLSSDLRKEETPTPIPTIILPEKEPGH